MALAAERMRALRERRRARGLRELRLVVPDARSKAVRRRVAKAVATLDRDRELIGHLDNRDVARLNIALAFVMGLAD